MKIKEKFADRFAEHDKRLMEAHIKKEKNSLKKELQRLEDERSMMRDHLYRLEALIEEHDDTHDDSSDQSTQTRSKDEHELWPHLEARLKDWENRFAKIWAKKADNHSDIEREYVEKELPLLRAEKRSVHARLKSMEGIIAKARILVDDLNEDLCRNFSGGRTLADVGEIILQEFDHKLKENQAKGRQTIRNFLERHLRISRTSSRDLFSLLEEVGILCYRVDLSGDIKDVPLVYYPYEDELSIGAAPGVLYQLDGWWEVMA
jgi:chromosome segregation ATPase